MIEMWVAAWHFLCQAFWDALASEYEEKNDEK